MNHRENGVGARLLRAGFGLPSGVLGRIGGRLMARGNAPTERHLVEIADLGEDDVVLVVGSGPGIGLLAAGQRSGQVTGVDPSELMVTTARRRCADLVDAGRVRVRPGTAADTGLSDLSVDAVLSVNNVQIWPDRRTGLAELRRVLLCTHLKWLPGGRDGLVADVEAAGFAECRARTWEPPGRSASTALLLRARLPSTA